MSAPRAAVTVRAVRPDDVPRVWGMLHDLAVYERLTHLLTGTPEMLRRALFEPEGARLEGLVAERPGGALAGYALFYPVYGSFRGRWRGWLEDLYVAPEARGEGVGRALLAALAGIARARGWYALDWEVLDWNAPAIGFYERLGSRRIAADWFRYRLSGEALERLAEGMPVSA
uniref:N-acetyltransferase n=1 Tax=Eiseniibacteriota bacterium TaxID=2212470 RepID=A0A832MLX1_UNCEI